MDADEDGIARGVGDAGAQFERNEDIVLARHDHFKTFGLKKRAQQTGDIERVLLLAAECAQRTLVETAVAGIEHDRLHLALVLEHLRAQLRLDGLGQIDPRDEKFPILGDDGEAEPVAHAVHDGFAAIERELKLVAAVVEDDGLAGGIDVAQEAVKFRDVVGAQVIARPDFDDLPIRRGSRRRLRWCSGRRLFFGKRAWQTFSREDFAAACRRAPRRSRRKEPKSQGDHTVEHAGKMPDKRTRSTGRHPRSSSVIDRRYR